MLFNESPKTFITQTSGGCILYAGQTLNSAVAVMRGSDRIFVWQAGKLIGEYVGTSDYGRCLEFQVRDGTMPKHPA